MTPGKTSAAPDRLIIASVVDHVYAAILERISNGSLPRGGPLRQAEIARELGVSRTPVREALRRLVAEGLVELRANHGARVTDLDYGRMRDAYEARLVVEPAAARLAAQHRHPKPLARMWTAVRDQRRAAGSVRRSFEVNREFHLALVAASGNGYLAQLAERLWADRIGAIIYDRQVQAQARMLLDAGEHERILEAIEAADGRRAESLTRRHLSAAAKSLSDVARETGHGLSWRGGE